VAPTTNTATTGPVTMGTTGKLTTNTATAGQTTSGILYATNSLTTKYYVVV